MNLDTLDRLAKTEPEMCDEPQAYKRAVLRMGYEAGAHVERALAELSDIGQEFEASAVIARLRKALDESLDDLCSDDLGRIKGVKAIRLKIRAALKEGT